MRLARPRIIPEIVNAAPERVRPVVTLKSAADQVLAIKNTFRTSQIAIAALATAVLLLLMWQYNDPAGGLGVDVIFALAPLALGLAWFKPADMALLFVAATMFRIHEAYPSLNPYHIPLLTAGLCILSVSLHLVRGGMVLPWRKEIKLALLFALHVTIGIAFSVNREVSLQKYADNFAKIIAGMVFLAMILRLPRDAMKIAGVLMLTSTLVSFVAIYNQINGIGLIEGTRVAISSDIDSLLGDPNDLCFVLMFPLAFGLSAIFTPDVSRGFKLASMSAVSFIVWAIIATKSRGGMIATVVVLGYLYARASKARILPMLIVAGAGLALYVVAGIGQRTYTFNATAAVDVSSLGRLEAWKAAVRMTMDHPVFGIGMGNFESLYRQYSDFWDGRTYVTHSMWFQIMSEAGIPGIALFVSMFVVSFHSARRSLKLLDDAMAPPQARALAASIVASWMGLAVAGSFLSQAFSWQVFILVSLTAVVGRYAETTYVVPASTSKAPQRGVHEGESLRATPQLAP
jgi:putative inorganic carbon (hco3(-)) transporter